MGERWRILHVEDDRDFIDQVKELLRDQSLEEGGEPPEIESREEFADALPALEEGRFDLLILDVRDEGTPEDDEEAGLRTLRAIQERRFIPVAFYTGVPHIVQITEGPLIKVIEKGGGGAERLVEALQGFVKSGLPAVNRALLKHVELVQRDYMWNFVSKHWDMFESAVDRTAIAELLARRLAMSLARSGVTELASSLGEEEAQIAQSDQAVSPIRYYVLPPLEGLHQLVGDVLKGEIGETSGHWVLLTPSCDLAQDKADRVLLARCLPLQEEHEYTNWVEDSNPSNTKRKELEGLLRNNRRKQPARYFFLPGVLEVPHLVVDLQHLVEIDSVHLAELQPVASLDSPFAEALVTRFTTYWGRLGTPDLDTEHVMNRLRRS